MRNLYIFIIRAILSLVFAGIVSRIFLGNISINNVLGLAAIMLGLAYLFERARSKNRGGDHGD